MSNARFINVSKSGVSGYNEFIDDMKKIIDKNQRNSFDFDSYDIAITLRRTNPEEDEQKGVRSLMFLVDHEIFENNPTDIRDEEELKMIINNAIFNDEIEMQWMYDHLYNFFQVFITLNYNGNVEVFESEYGINMDDLIMLPQEIVCAIMNVELAWMGLVFKFYTTEDDTYNFKVIRNAY